MEIIGAEAAGAGAQTDQPAALGEKKEGEGGLFGLVLARLAEDGDADENEGEGTDQRSTDSTGPVFLAGLLVPAALQQVEPSAPTLASAGATEMVLAVASEDVSGQGGASAGSLPYVPPPPTPAAQLAPGAGQAGESPSSPGAAVVEPGRTLQAPASLGAVTSQDAGNAESGDESGTTPEEPSFTPAKAGVQHKPSSPHAVSGDPSSPAVLDSHVRGNGDESAGVTHTPDAGVRRNDGTSESDETSETARVDAVRQPAMDHVPFGNEKLAAENLSAPPPASPAAASAQALSKALPPIQDPASVAGSAFQRDMLQIQLPPSDLGRITMQVSVHARQVQAAVSVEHQGLGAYLAAGQGALDDAVRQHGLRVEEFRVDLLDLGAGRTGQGQDSPEFQGRQDALPGRPLPDAVPSAQTGFPQEGEPEEAAALRRINVFA